MLKLAKSQPQWNVWSALHLPNMHFFQGAAPQRIPLRSLDNCRHFLVPLPQFPSVFLNGKDPKNRGSLLSGAMPWEVKDPTQGVHV